MRNQDLTPCDASGAAIPLRADDTIQIAGAILRGVRMHFDRNAEIFGEGAPADYVYRLVSGAVRIMRFSAEGRRQILDFLIPGDVFGLEFGKTHALSAEAVTECQIVMVRRGLLDKLAAESCTAARGVLSLLAEDLRRNQDHALVLGRKGAAERVAAFLLEMSARAGAKGDLDLPMSRSDIADYLGLTIESVSRAFSEMERQCAIALPSSRHVVMRSRARLCELEAA